MPTVIPRIGPVNTSLLLQDNLHTVRLWIYV